MRKASKLLVSVFLAIAVMTAFVPLLGTQTVYAASKPGKVTVSSLKATSTSTLTVKWKKVSAAKGYQIRYSTRSSMAGAKKVITTARNRTITKLKAGTRYYVQIRAYKKGNKKVYGQWSKKRSVTTHYSIKYVLNGGTQASGQITAYTKASATFSLKAPTRDGYEFDGWYTTSSYDEKVTTIKKGTTGNKTFYAKWISTEVPGNTDIDLSDYLMATANCQVGDPSIKTVVDSLTATLTTDADKANAIYEYVRDCITYVYYSNTKYGAVDALANQEGNCVDQAHLLVAMLRTANIPARYHHGTNCRFRNGLVTGHVWAECTFDGETWHTLDPTSANNSFDVIKNWDTASYEDQGTYSSLPF